MNSLKPGVRPLTTGATLFQLLANLQKIKSCRKHKIKKTDDLPVSYQSLSHLGQLFIHTGVLTYIAKEISDMRIPLCQLVYSIHSQIGALEKRYIDKPFLIEQISE